MSKIQSFEKTGNHIIYGINPQVLVHRNPSDNVCHVFILGNKCIEIDFVMYISKFDKILDKAQNPQQLIGKLLKYRIDNHAT